MPYIKQNRREVLYPRSVVPAATAGELNYQITMLCRRWLDTFGTNYEHINTVVGALECAKIEFSRRVAAPYEDLKIAENGDVYGTPR
jgi:hypothetical protein